MRRYITGFNGLRTLGVLAVIFYHVYPNVLRGGFLGVVLFFVLSGYLVTDSFLGRYEKTKTFGWQEISSFWLRRLKRIYPLLLTIFFVVTPYLLIFQRNLLQGMRDQFMSSIVFVQNWWQISQGASYFANITGESPFKHIYYLAIEEQFFLLWPLVLLFLVKFIRSRGHNFLITNVLALVSVAAMVVMFQPGQDPTRVYYGTDTRVFSLLMGASLAFIWPTYKMNSKITQKGYQLSRNLTFAVLALIALAYFFMPAQSAITYYGGMWLVSLLSLLLVALVAHPAFAGNKILSNPVFDWVGTRSYGIYLWQLPVFALVQLKILNPTAWYNVIWQLVLIGLLSELSYRWVELPFKNFNYDYKTLFARVKAYFVANLKAPKTLVIYAVTLLVLLGLVVIFTAPGSPHDQKILEQKIMQQQATLQSSEIKKETKEVSTSLKSIASKYGVSPLVAQKASKMKLVAVGDSVMVAGSTDLQEAFPHITIDASVGRQTADGAKELDKLKSKVKAADAVLIGLGTNGTISAQEINAILKAAAGKTVYWINVNVPRVWEKSDNQILADTAKKNKQLKIVDWASTSHGKNEWFYSDHIHPYGEGAINYTKLVMNVVAKVDLAKPGA